MNVEGFKKAFSTLTPEEQQRVVSQLSDEELSAISNPKKEAVPSALSVLSELPITPLPFRMLPNVPSGAMNVIGGFANIIRHPVNTLSDAQTLISGAAQKIPGVSEGLDYARARLPEGLPIGTREDIKMADAFGNLQKERYGGAENIKNTMVQDPVGFLMDASLLASGAGLGLKAAGATNAAKTAQAIAKGTNPIYLTGKAVSETTKGLGGIAREVLAPVGGTVKDVYRGFAKSGPQTIAEENLQKIAGIGGESELASVKAALTNPQAIVPGSPLTSADAIAGANQNVRFGSPMVRLQEEIGRLPESTGLLKTTELAQEAARKSSLSKITNQTGRAAAEAKVAEAGSAYDAIKATRIQSNSTLKSLAKSKAFQLAEERAQAISQNENAVARASKLKTIPFKIIKDGKTEYSAQGLQHIKQSLDEMASSPTLRTQLGLFGTEKNAIGSVRTLLVKWMNHNIPGWEKARTDYRSAKLVTDRMDIGKLLEEKLTGVRGEERATQFLQAVRDAPKTVKTATGRQLFDKLSDVMTPEQTKIINNIQKELQRDSLVTRMARETNIPGDAKVALGNPGSILPPLLWRPSMVANWILNTARKDITPDVGRITGGLLNDPAKTLAVLNKVSKSPGTIKRLTGLLAEQQRLGPILYQAGLLEENR